MDSDQQATLIQPAVVLHPGEIVVDYLEFRGWTQRDLARRTGLTPKTISEICNGKAPITAPTALALEKVLQRPAHFWLNLQRQFDEAEARRLELAKSAEWSDWARKFPLKDMRRLRFLKPGQSEADALLNFLGVSSPESWSAVWSAANVAYRQTRKFTTNVESVSAWVRETELVASELQTADFDELVLRSSLESLRRLTRKRADEIMDPIQGICAAAGVAVVWVPELPHCGISGCARWLSDKKALIGLTLRYKTDDQMWFTFFHELGHVLLHRKKRAFVLDNAADSLSDQVVDPEMQRYESEANQFAADTLIPPAALGEFVRRKNFASEDIHNFAEEIGIGPGIVVGRLQRDGLLARHQGNALKQKLNWQFAEDA
ncbi:HigA family addiction module antitoxin [Bradyrhizobium japonicum]|uniref:HigA family addiction module antitoxin n=1 Tax=Bradyrhizobium japonicum TaxID=375 RepID=UPI0009B7F4C8|nr:HigA family addiction module antitoxin [Bradyrhizobium japonicum]